MLKKNETRRRYVFSRNSDGEQKQRAKYSAPQSHYNEQLNRAERTLANATVWRYEDAFTYEFYKAYAKHRANAGLPTSIYKAIAETRKLPYVYCPMEFAPIVARWILQEEPTLSGFVAIRYSPYDVLMSGVFDG